MKKKIGIIVGSLRKGSFNRKMANTLITVAPTSLQCQIIDISNLSLYNQDLDDENQPPTNWVDFRHQVKPCDGILFVTPEYNRSIPGVLKNAIDIGSRPYGQSVWEGKPCAVMSVSPSAIGGFGANQHLRQAFVFLNMPALQMPEAYIGKAAELFNEKNELIKEDTKQFVTKFMDAFANWVEKIG